VLALPENQQLIYKQFAVTFTNLGHAYCEKGNRLVDSDRATAPTYFAKAIKVLQTAKQNTRFFPSAEYDEAVHDTYYYTALSYHKLYLITKQPAVMNSASLAWREYFDFFPKKLEGNPAFVQAREGRDGTAIRSRNSNRAAPNAMHLRRPVMTLLVAIALPVGAGEEPVTSSPGEPAGIEPEFVRPLVPIARGRNDSNPVWSPTGDMVAFERSRGDNKEIAIVRANGDIVQIIHQQASAGPGQSPFFFPEVVAEQTSYNSGISWSPSGKRFVFMSNGGEGNYDLYLREPDGRITRITTHREKDGHAHWSPARDQIAFISGRSGKGDVYLLDLATKATTRLTHGEWPYLYPQWSPDGKRLAVIQGINENHDVYVLETGHNPPVPPMPLSTWRYDDLRPVWSPTASASRSTPITTPPTIPRPGPS